MSRIRSAAIRLSDGWIVQPKTLLQTFTSLGIGVVKSLKHNQTTNIVEIRCKGPIPNWFLFGEVHRILPGGKNTTRVWMATAGNKHTHTGFAQTPAKAIEKAWAAHKMSGLGK